MNDRHSISLKIFIIAVSALWINQQLHLFFGKQSAAQQAGLLILKHGRKQQMKPRHSLFLHF